MRLPLFVFGVLMFCMTSAAQAQNKLAASSATDTTAGPVTILAESAVDPGAPQQQPAVQPRLAAEAQDPPAKKEERRGNAAPKKEE